MARKPPYDREKQIALQDIGWIGGTLKSLVEALTDGHKPELTEDEVNELRGRLEYIIAQFGPPRV